MFNYCNAKAYDAKGTVIAVSGVDVACNIKNPLINGVKHLKYYKFNSKLWIFNQLQAIRLLFWFHLKYLHLSYELCACHQDTELRTVFLLSA